MFDGVPEFVQQTKTDQANHRQDDEFLHSFRLNLAQRNIVRPSAEFWRSKRARFIGNSMRTPHGE